MDDHLKSLCINTIESVINEYKNNEYMLSRIKHYYLHYLPNQLSIEDDNNKTKNKEHSSLINEQNIFIQVFLQKNLFYYLPSNGFFFEYSGNNFKIVKEDDIIHNLLSTITRDKILVSWKEKTKTVTLKKIKERNLFDCTPESETIQNVIAYLYPSIFESKNYAKYFLTVIGDVILKKNQFTFLVSPQIKKMIINIEDILSACIGINNISSHFITKHHENNIYDKYRLLRINSGYSIELWKSLLKNIGLNLICVACHYSKRQQTSDDFLEAKLDEPLKQYTHFLKNNKPTEIIDDFCNKYISASETLQMTWKECHFLWKEYLQENNLYNVLYSTFLHKVLKTKYRHDNINDLFIGVTSEYLPKQKQFLVFWNETMQQDTIKDFDDEVEIDEIYTCYKNWGRANKDIKYVSEEKVLNILRHFYPDLVIIDDKYIINISIVSWDKISDINYCLSQYIITEIPNYDLSLVCLDDIYLFYEKLSLQQNKLVVSKRYFEKYISFKFKDLIVYEKFIPIDKLIVSSG